VGFGETDGLTPFEPVVGDSDSIKEDKSSSRFSPLISKTGGHIEQNYHFLGEKVLPVDKPFRNILDRALLCDSQLSH
jgi:hypothetical protein